MKSAAMAIIFLGIIAAVSYGSEDAGTGERIRSPYQYSRQYTRYTRHPWSARARPAARTARPTHWPLYKQGGPYYIGFFGEYYGGARPGDPSMDTPVPVTKTDISNERTTPADVPPIRERGD
jgi:hypothetical protein